jgi:hypothetical protein
VIVTEHLNGDFAIRQSDLVSSLRGRSLKAPILFLVFNRPETTRRVFETIRQAQPPRLYIAADGPRDDKPDDHATCDTVREIVSVVDWSCEVRTLFRKKNLGCSVAVTGAINWFFEHEAEGIILEDDCLPDRSFFKFCEELLERYRSEPSVMMISGGFYLDSQYEIESSYFFSKHVDVWGWAGWRRAWQHNDPKMTLWPNLRDSDWLKRIGNGHRDFEQFWTEVFDNVRCGRVDTWDYQWVFSCWLQNGLTVVPSRNLVKNIGFGDDATHTKLDGGRLSKVPLETIPFPLKHPDAIMRDCVADRWIDLIVYGIKNVPAYRRFLRKIPGLRQVVRKMRPFAS